MKKQSGGFVRIEQLEQVIAVAQCGSITGAAAQLFMSQPNLTKSIAALENEFQTQFFRRTARGVLVTSEGREFIRYAEDVLASIRSLNASFGSSKGERIRRLSVASQRFDFVSRLLLDIYRSHQNELIRFNLQQVNRSEIIDNILGGTCSLGLLVRSELDAKTFMWHSDVRSLRVQTLDTGPMYVCVGPKSPFYDTDAVPQDEAERSNRLTLDMRFSDITDTYVSSHGRSMSSDKIVAFNSIESCQTFLLETDALLFVSKWALGCFANEGLRCLPISGSRDTDTELIIVWRQDEELCPTEREFVQRLEAYFSTSLER